MSVKSQWPKLPAKFLIQFLMHWAVLQSRKTRHEVVPCCNTGEVVSKLGKPMGRANLVNGSCTLPVAQVRIYVNALSGWLLTCWVFFSLTTFVLTHKFVMYLKCVVTSQRVYLLKVLHKHWTGSVPWTASHCISHTDCIPVVLAHGQPPVWCWTSLERRRHWETEHLPSPDRVSGTAYLLPSVIRHCRRQSSESCWKLICLFKGRGAGDLWTGALEMYWLTNWLTTSCLAILEWFSQSWASWTYA